MSAESQWSARLEEPETINTESLASVSGSFDAPGSNPSRAGIESHGRPDAPGWSSAATAIHSLWKMPTPMLLVLQPEGYNPIVLDVRNNEFTWSSSLDAFPPEPRSVVVYTQPVSHDDDVVVGNSAKNLDGLLWRIGLNSFAGALAWWLPEGERYHASRWPNLTELVHSFAQMRMIALLANAYFSPNELAAAASSSPVEARALLNALSLMGILQSSSTVPEPVPQPAPQADVAQPARSLFQRLLDRLSDRG